MPDPATGGGWRALDARRRRVLLCTVSANALVFFDQTAVTVALPAIGRDLGVPANGLQWTITVYLLALAVLMPLAGRIADHVGRRRTFLTGLAVFGVGSALCAVAPTFPLLLAARFVQGVGGAVVAPLALSTVTRAVGDARRGWAIGVLATGGTSFLVLGPLLAGVLLRFGWRWLFLVGLPVVAVAMWLGARSIVPSREAVPTPIDRGGAVLLLVALAGLTAGAVEIAHVGPVALVPLGAGLVALGLFVRHERHTAHPLVDVRLLGDPMLASSLVALFSIQFAVFGATVSLALYLQHGLGESALVAGLVLALAGLGTPLLSLATGRVTDRRGPRFLVPPGLALAAAGLGAVALLAPAGGLLVLLPGLLLLAVARPLVFTPASAGPFLALDAEQRAFAAGLATESRQLGAVMGVALTTTALVAVHGTTLVDGDAGLVAGFRAAVLVTAAVCAVGALVTWRLMPARDVASPAAS
jgi:EmrB/QacA subfamily drug resistance transporter